MRTALQSASRRMGGVAGLAVLLCLSATGRADPPGCLTLDRLRDMSECELAALYTRSDVGSPPVGAARGGLVRVTDRFLPRVKAGMANFCWRGKVFQADGCFVNRWACGIQAIRSRYTIGPSWVDGRPAVLMDYPPGTPLFANLHDELREVTPGLYLGPVFERCPAPRLRGYVAVQLCLE